MTIPTATDGFWIRSGNKPEHYAKAGRVQQHGNKGEAEGGVSQAI